MNRWVYRRPYFRIAKPKIPLHRGQAPFAALRRLRALRRKRHVIRRRIILAGGVAAQQAVTHAPIRRVRIKPKQRIRPKIRRAVLPPVPTFVGKQGPIPRFLKAVLRMRRHMLARLRWKPRPEFIPPVIVVPSPGHAIDRGSIYSAGAVEGSIYSAGSKRGWVE